MEENKNALDEVNKGCSMGIEAINDLIDKIDNKGFKTILKKELDDYRAIEDRIEEIYSNYGEGEPHKIGKMSKIMTDSMLGTKTMIDHTDSKIAELLLQGTNMGIIEGRRILNNKSLDKEVSSIMNDFVSMQEKSIENLKKYL